MKNYAENNKQTKKFFLRTPRKFTFKSACILFFITSLLLALSYGAFMLFSKNTAVIEGDCIHCTEVGKIDYEVNLNQDQKELPDVMESNMSYLSSLINTVNLKINYDLNYDRTVPHKYKYKVLANFVVTDKNVKDSKDNILISTTDQLCDYDFVSEDGDKISISDAIVLPYAKYNRLATQFANKHDVDMEACVNVKLIVETDGKSANVESMNRVTELGLKVPLFDKTIDIDESNAEINDNFVFEACIPNVRNISLGAMCLILAVTILSMEVAIILAYVPKYKGYYKKMNFIYKNYGYLIVNVIGEKSFNDMLEENTRIRYIREFRGMVTASEILRQPIKCYREKSDDSVYFVVDNMGFERYLYIMHNNDT